MAPVAPFYSDRLYRDLTHSENSVHLASFPKSDANVIDKQLEKRMKAAQDITTLVLSLRRKQNIKVRQPLQAIMVPVLDEQQHADIESVAGLIKGEVNVKELKLVGNDAGILVKRVKPDFKKLGPKYGKIMKALAAKITNLSQPEIAQFEKDGKLDIDVDGQLATVELTDVEIISEDIPGWLVANDGNLTVALDITITEELQQEGIARELVNRIQNLRKSKKFDITDRITVIIAPDERTDAAVHAFGDYIARQVLATSISLAPVPADKADELDMDGWMLPVSVEKV